MRRPCPGGGDGRGRGGTVGGGRQALAPQPPSEQILMNYIWNTKGVTLNDEEWVRSEYVLG